MDNVALTVKSYGKAQDWPQFFFKGKTLKDIPMHESWEEFFKENIFTDKRFQVIEDTIKNDVKDGEDIVPRPNMMFNTFFITPLEEVKVVIIGQDPYFNTRTNGVPEAVGLSFSVPTGIPVPSSLKSIYRNMTKFGCMNFQPSTGNLMFWALQGCLLLNTALTVRLGQKKSHSKIWKWATNEMIQYISYKCDHVVFLLWGSDAYSKSELIDQDKHDIIVSSHPSGLSCAKPFRNYPPFDKADHFAKTNELLKKHKQTPIIWQLP